MTTSDEGEGTRKTEHALAPQQDGRSMKATHPLGDKFKDPFTQHLAADAGTQDSCPEGGGKAGMSHPGERRASDSATADEAQGKLDGKAAKRPASFPVFARGTRLGEDDLEDYYRRNDSQ